MRIKGEHQLVHMRPLHTFHRTENYGFWLWLLSNFNAIESEGNVHITSEYHRDKKTSLKQLSRWDGVWNSNTGVTTEHERHVKSPTRMHTFLTFGKIYNLPPLDEWKTFFPLHDAHFRFGQLSQLTCWPSLMGRLNRAVAWLRTVAQPSLFTFLPVILASLIIYFP